MCRQSLLVNVGDVHVQNLGKEISKIAFIFIRPLFKTKANGKRHEMSRRIGRLVNSTMQMSSKTDTFTTIHNIQLRVSIF